MVGGQPIGEEAINDVLTNASILKPRDQLSIAVMPVQDAMDLAVFLASVQIQMERFLPGDSLCGGPIDVMVLKTAPVQEILWFPGKDLKHPLAGRGN